MGVVRWCVSLLCWAKFVWKWETRFSALSYLFIVIITDWAFPPCATCARHSTIACLLLLFGPVNRNAVSACLLHSCCLECELRAAPRFSRCLRSQSRLAHSDQQTHGSRSTVPE
jgi:hypothetical protein